MSILIGQIAHCAGKLMLASFTMHHCTHCASIAVHSFAVHNFVYTTLNLFVNKTTELLYMSILISQNARHAHCSP